MRQYVKLDVARVKQLLAQGLSQKAVSVRLGCSASAVQAIAAGKYGGAK